MLSQSECGADNNVAMYFLAAESAFIDEIDNVLNDNNVYSRPAGVAGGHIPWSHFREQMMSACSNVIRTVFFDPVNYPCDPNPKFPYLVVRALCPTTCAMSSPTTPAPAAPLDEADPPGASRQLTTSWSGKMSGLGDLTASFAYEYPATPMDLSVAANKKLVYRSYSVTTSISSSPAPFSSVCQNANNLANAANYPEAQAAFALLDNIDESECWYRSAL
jgi:hypothetical protein